MPRPPDSPPAAYFSRAAGCRSRLAPTGNLVRQAENGVAHRRLDPPRRERPRGQFPALLGAAALPGMKAVHQDFAFLQAVGPRLAGLELPPEVLVAPQSSEHRAEHL